MKSLSMLGFRVVLLMASMLCLDGAASPAVVSVAVIGGGLSGLTAALRLLQAGETVALIDKSSFFGGNSAKASSGINGCLTDKQKEHGIPDSPETFFADTMRSAQRGNDTYTATLARVMADHSKEALKWIAANANVDLIDVGQMGGHSIPRTHRPRGRLSGAAFISGLEKSVMKYLGRQLSVYKSTSLSSMTSTAHMWDLSLTPAKTAPFVLKARNTLTLTLTPSRTVFVVNNNNIITHLSRNPIYPPLFVAERGTE